MNLGWLLKKFNDAADRPALIWQDREFSYRWLRNRIEDCQREFASRGLNSKTVVAVEADYSPESCALLLALIRHDCIVVPLASPAGGDPKRLREVAEVQAVFKATGADQWDFQHGDVQIENPLTRRLIDLGHPGLVLFSSGSSGESKAVLHDLSRLLTKFQVPRHSLRTIAFLLFDHIGGINTLFYVLANTGTIVITPERSPDSVCASIERHRVELLPTSPTFLNLVLLSEAYRGHDLSSLKIITYGTEPMSQATLARLHQVFPDAQLTQTYGLSELGILRAKSRSSDSLFMKVGGEGFETKVVDGILWIRAESAMLGYLNAPSPFDAEGWFNTGDEVEVCGEFLRVLGRRSEVINVGGEKVFPAEVEGVIETLPRIAEVTVRGEPNPITGQTVVAHVRLSAPEEPLSLRTRIRNACRERLALYKIPTKVVVISKGPINECFKKIRRNSV